MDYSICDALKAGFNRVVFIIRRDLEQDFREMIGEPDQPDGSGGICISVSGFSAQGV